LANSLDKEIDTEKQTIAIATASGIISYMRSNLGTEGAGSLVTIEINYFAH